MFWRTFSKRSKSHASFGIPEQKLALEPCPVKSHELLSAQAEVGAEKQDTACLLPVVRSNKTTFIWRLSEL